MKPGELRVDGELYLSLETVAEIYEVKRVFLEEAYHQGLFGIGVEAEPGLCIAAVQLDRVATVARLHLHLGLGLETIALTLGTRCGG